MIQYTVRCEGKCIKQYTDDILEYTYPKLKQAKQYVHECCKKKFGYKCVAEIFREGK